MLNSLLLTFHPIIITIAFVGAVSYLASIQSFRFLLKELFFYSYVNVLITIMYASFVHNGITPLFFYNDHPITLEAIVHGAMLGFTFTTAALWFKAYVETMQTNHFLFLFTKIHPKLGLLSAMAFRFYPYYKELWYENRRGQQGMHYFLTASRFERFTRWWLLQVHTIVQTIDAVFWKPSIMLSKGYQKKRTQFQLFSWGLSDSFMFILLIGMFIVNVLYTSIWEFHYFPQFMEPSLSIIQLVSLCMFYGLPAIVEGKELIKWHYLQSKI